MDYVKLLPQNYRSITERLRKLKLYLSSLTLKIKKSFKFPKRNFMVLFFLYLVMNLFVFSFLLFYFVNNYNLVILQREYARRELDYWEDVVRKHSNYVDAHYKSSYFASKLGEKEKALEYVDKALILDPGFKRAEELRNVIMGLEN